ncbi:MAG: hypothetical protein WDO56_08885 [Gammaproteobacteria bacterium]
MPAHQTGPTSGAGAPAAGAPQIFTLGPKDRKESLGGNRVRVTPEHGEPFDGTLMPDGRIIRGAARVLPDA